MVSPVVKVKTEISRAGNSGFTLLELLITSSLIVIFMTITVLSISRIYERYEKREDLRNLINSIKYSRIIALTENRVVSLRFSEDGRSYYIDGRTKPRSLRRGLKVNGEPIYFYPSGSNSGGSLSLIDENGRDYIITVDPLTSKVTLTYE